MRLQRFFWMAAAVGMSAFAQISNNQSLTGKYNFREILLITDGTANVIDTRTGFGTLTFDGNGAYTVSGQQLVGILAPGNLPVTNGTYTVKGGGFATLSNPLRSGATINARLGAGALVGSSTEAGATVFDLFIAIPAPAQPVSTSTLSGAYWISSLEFPNAALSNIRNTNFKFTANGSGNFAESSITGQALNLGNTLQTQTIGPNTYTVAFDGSGTLTFAATTGLDSTRALIYGIKNIFVAQDGSYFIGGSTVTGQHGLVVGVKAFDNGTANNASWNGFFWTAGMRYDVAAPGFPARLAAVSGGVHANADGNSIWARRTRQTDGLFDASPLITYNLQPYGSGVFGTTAGSVNVASTGQVFSSTGVDVESASSYEIYFGAKLIPQSGSGVFLNPQGVLNSASLAPPGSPLSPGGLITLFGTGLGNQSATASAPFPPALAGVSVTVNNATAPVYSVVPSQISAVVPFGVTGPTATVVVTVNGTKSNAVEVPMAASAPGVFSVPPNGISGVAARHLNGVLVNAANPASRGEFVSVYLTGLGAVSPAVQDGAAAPGAEPFARSTGALAVYIGGQPVTTIQYKGLAPTLAGLYQVNIQIPLTAPSGMQNLAVQTVEGFTDLVSIAIQ